MPAEFETSPLDNVVRSCSLGMDGKVKTSKLPGNRTHPLDIVDEAEKKAKSTHIDFIYSKALDLGKPEGNIAPIHSDVPRKFEYPGCHPFDHFNPDESKVYHICGGPGDTKAKKPSVVTT